LETAYALLVEAGRQDMLKKKRDRCMKVPVNGIEVSLRDQAPLHEANVAFEGNWQFEDLVEALNRLTFFWPGDAVGPNLYGRRHFERYRLEETVALRVPTSDLLSSNAQVTPLFCGFNSGSPRHSGGFASPRGPHTFLGACEFARTPTKVVELTFPSGVLLPATTECRLSPDAPGSSSVGPSCFHPND
jgi:hypothetical protein